ncbi:hypothetical protein [Candidatus Nitrotoga sp. 1052]|uniref:hypothetical protein n=1 Tax=Candidatus Nitrotoga sp. 1052 TaxID=2886964 RepID=UPI001EF6F818|nr:hypothetical protein [Candidatus Nitrotoga sp. 1052]
MSKQTKTPPSFAALVQAYFVEYLIQQRALSAQTIAAYRDGFVLFLAASRASPHYLAVYTRQLSIATLNRRVVAIGRAHTIKGLPSPAHSERVKATLLEIRRTVGSAQPTG